MRPESAIGRIIAAGLIVGLPLILSACESNPNQAPSVTKEATSFPPAPDPKARAVLTEQDVRKDIGIWSKEDIERLANTMISDPRFTNLLQAGEILLGNQQDSKTVSSETSLFSDNRIQIETVQNLDNDHPGRSIPMDASVVPNQPILITSFKSKDGGKDLTIQTGTSLRFDRIRISHDIMNAESNFINELFLAKEVYNIKAFDIVTSRIVEQLSSQYDISGDRLTRDAVRTYSIHGTDRGASVSAIADMLAHFLILPDYNLAKDLGILDPERSENSFWVLNTSTKFLIEGGTLAKDPDGVYRWKGDINDVNEMLYRLAWAGVKANILG